MFISPPVFYFHILFQLEFNWDNMNRMISTFDKIKIIWPAAKPKMSYYVKEHCTLLRERTSSLLSSEFWASCWALIFCGPFSFMEVFTDTAIWLKLQRRGKTAQILSNIQAVGRQHFEPFVVESGGELGERAQEIFKKICNFSPKQRDKVDPR